MMRWKKAALSVSLALAVFAGACSSSPATNQGSTDNPAQIKGAVTWQVAMGASASSGSIEVEKFIPGVITINVGDSITWTNNTPLQHTITFTNNNPNAAQFPTQISIAQGGTTCCTSNLTVASGPVRTGGKLTVKFETVGEFAYQCDFRAGMSGSVVVRPQGSVRTTTPSQELADQQNEAELDIEQARQAAYAAPVQPTTNNTGNLTHYVTIGSATSNSATVDLNPVGDSNVRGSAQITENKSQVSMTLSLNDMDPAAKYDADIRFGSCALGGPIAFNLQSPKPDRLGNVNQVSSTIPGASILASAGWFLEISVQHPGRVGNAIETSVSCGDISTFNSISLTFNPADLQIGAGDTVEWVNVTPQEFHTVTFLGTGKAPSTDPLHSTSVGGPNYTSGEFATSGALHYGQTWSLTFPNPGSYHYVCLVHRKLAMTGTITVAPSVTTTSTLVPGLS